jgi:ketosteroid isomerase-like protein
VYQADPVTFPPAGRPPITKSGLQAFQDAARAVWQGLPAVEVYGLAIAEGGHVALQVSITGTTRTGVDLVVRNAFFLTIVDGRIRRLDLHLDTAAPSRAQMGDRLSAYLDEHSPTFFKPAGAGS